MHRKRLLGKRFAAFSPNKRFESGAAKIDGKALQRIESHGKNLFYFFEGSLVVHIHFGMSGYFRLHSLEKAPEPRATTRLKLINVDENIVALLSAMTVSLHDEAWYSEKIQEIGPDPTREDADKERLWAKWQKTSRAVGLVLMDQSMLAGVGNIFRAEILFKAGVHPEQPAKTISRDGFERVWLHCVGCLQAGVKHGSIRTVDPEEASILGKPWKRRYIYNQSTCGRCGCAILSWLVSSRRAYCCPSCQQLPPNTEIREERKKVLDAAARSHLFPSMCARDPPVTTGPSLAKLKTNELRTLLQSRDLDSRGPRAGLLARLHAHDSALGNMQESLKPNQEDENPTPLTPERKKFSFKVGTGDSVKQHVEIDGALSSDQGLMTSSSQLGPNDNMATALEAALERFEAGEKRSVEHIAEMDDDVATALEKQIQKSRRRRAIQDDFEPLVKKERATPLQATGEDIVKVGENDKFQTPPKRRRLRKLSEIPHFKTLQPVFTDAISIY